MFHFHTGVFYTPYGGSYWPVVCIVDEGHLSHTHTTEQLRAACGKMRLLSGK